MITTIWRSVTVLVGSFLMHRSTVATSVSSGKGLGR